MSGGEEPVHDRDGVADIDGGIDGHDPLEVEYPSLQVASGEEGGQQPAERVPDDGIAGRRDVILGPPLAFGYLIAIVAVIVAPDVFGNWYR